MHVSNEDFVVKFVSLRCWHSCLLRQRGLKLSSRTIMHRWMHFQNEDASWCVRINPLFRGDDVEATESSAPVLKLAQAYKLCSHNVSRSTFLRLLHAVGRIKTLSAHLQANAATCVQVHKIKFNVAYGRCSYVWVCPPFRCCLSQSCAKPLVNVDAD